MPDIAKSGRASAESFSHDFLKHLPVVSRENACVPGHRFSSIPSHLNNARMEVFSPLCKPPEDGYQSDCESDASQMQNPASLIISKVTRCSPNLKEPMLQPPLSRFPLLCTLGLRLVTCLNTCQNILRRRVHLPTSRGTLLAPQTMRETSLR